MSIKPEFLIERQGKTFVLYAGLLDLAHAQGLRAIRTRLIQVPDDDNGLTAIVSAEVETAIGTFSGIGDANPANVSRMMLTNTIRLAETRAKARALRDAVNIGVAALEELGDGDDVSAPPPSQRPAPMSPAPQPPKPTPAPKALAPPSAPPDWPRFWIHVKGLGLDNDAVHKALGVESVREWRGSLDEAIAVIERFVLARNGAPAGAQYPATPSVDLATSAQVRAIYGLGRDKRRMTERETEEKSSELFGAIPAELTRVQASDFIKALQGTPTLAAG